MLPHQIPWNIIDIPGGVFIGPYNYTISSEFFQGPPGHIIQLCGPHRGRSPHFGRGNEYGGWVLLLGEDGKYVFIELLVSIIKSNRYGAPIFHPLFPLHV